MGSEPIKTQQRRVADAIKQAQAQARQVGLRRTIRGDGWRELR
jgi:hypothetical protein